MNNENYERDRQYAWMRKVINKCKCKLQFHKFLNKKLVEGYELYFMIYSNSPHETEAGDWFQCSKTDKITT